MHLWRVGLPESLEPESVRRLAAMLPAEDLWRCERCRPPAAYAQELTSRAALRGVLGACLQEDPRHLSLVEGPGKPRLAGNAGLEFSLSHSAGLALLAVGRSVRVGVDVERERHVPGLENLVERFFSEQERRQLLDLRGAEQRAAFFRLWTRKEAAAKALGLGILEFLRRRPAGEQPLQGDWQLIELRPARGYAGAVCREGQGTIGGFWVWREPWLSS